MADKKEEPAAETKSSGGLLPIINLVLLVLVLAVGSFIAWKMMSMKQATPPEVQSESGQIAATEMPVVEDEDPNAVPIFVDLADITINLADTEVSRFLRAKIKLELRNEAAQPRVEQEMIKINDMVLTLLSSKTFDEIRTAQGKYDLKEDIVYRVNRLVGGKPVKNMYFTDFVSQ